MKIHIWTAPYCECCANVKKAFKENNVPFVEHSYDELLLSCIPTSILIFALAEFTMHDMIAPVAVLEDDNENPISSAHGTECIKLIEKAKQLKISD